MSWSLSTGRAARRTSASAPPAKGGRGEGERSFRSHSHKLTLTNLIENKVWGWTVFVLPHFLNWKQN
jgi:hypothetical protein